jgi:uncharacterized protein YybS (DUF2232 family)
MISDEFSFICAKVSVITNVLYFTIWVIINNVSNAKTENIFMYGTFIPYRFSFILSVILVIVSLLFVVVFYKKQLPFLIPIQLLFVSVYLSHYLHLVRR